MIRACTAADLPAILAVINDAAEAYRAVIPADRWKEPYMPADELEAEIAAGVAFHGWQEAGALVAVMGLQPVRDVMLIRHAYVRPAYQRRGIGSALLAALAEGLDRPVLIGTWAAADWAIRFYRGRGFRLIDEAHKAEVLRRYWSIPDRQVETSVVLADAAWFARGDG